MNSELIHIVIGCTGTGKSDYAIKLAKEWRNN